MSKRGYITIFIMSLPPGRLVKVKEEEKENGERLPRSNPAPGRIVLISYSTNLINLLH